MCFFGHTIAGNTLKLKKLINSPVSDHGTKSVVHKIVVLTMKACYRTLDNRAKPINLIHNELLNKQVSTNRSKLLSVSKTVLFCGRQNIPLLGNRDYVAYYGPHDCGNFEALFVFEKFSNNMSGKKSIFFSNNSS